MKSENEVRDLSKEFALKIIRLYRYLCEDKKEYVMAKQVLRSGTSIGANIREAECAQSRADFYAKLCIAYKEANETLYWLELLHESKYINDKQFDVMYSDARSLFNLLSSITNKLKSKTKSDKG